MKKTIVAIIVLAVLIGVYFVLRKTGDKIGPPNHAVENEMFFRDVVRTDLAPKYKDFPSKDPADLNATPRITFEVNAVDLNGDKFSEYIVEGVTVNGSYMGGASGNEEKYVYQYQNGAWKNIGIINGNGYNILDTITNGYRDIKTGWHLSVTTATETIYKWDANKSEYKEASSKEVEFN